MDGMVDLVETARMETNLAVIEAREDTMVKKERSSVAKSEVKMWKADGD